MVGLAWLPFGSTISEFGIGQFYVKTTGDRIDLDDVAILQQCDRATPRRLRPDMADAEAAGCAGETTVRDQGDLAAHALPGQCGRRGKDFAHAGTTARG